MYHDNHVVKGKCQKKENKKSFGIVKPLSQYSYYQQQQTGHHFSSITAQLYMRISIFNIKNHTTSMVSMWSLKALSVN